MAHWEKSILKVVIEDAKVKFQKKKTVAQTWDKLKRVSPLTYNYFVVTNIPFDEHDFVLN